MTRCNALFDAPFPVRTPKSLSLSYKRLIYLPNLYTTYTNLPIREPVIQSLPDARFNRLSETVRALARATMA